MKKRLLLCLLGLMGCTFSAVSQSNEGTDFWMGFMEHRDINANTKVLMITARNATTGTVSVPRQNWSQSFSVNANDVSIITLPMTTETQGSEAIQSTGIRIQAATPVSVYAHQYANFRSEAAVILPVESIGREYYAMSYLGYESSLDIYPSEFLIVAVEDQTTLTYRVTSATRGGGATGSLRTIVLNLGQTYQVQSAAGPTGDLTGSYVSGDKDFVLMSGARWAEMPLGCGTRDNLLEQMYPVSTWGRRFVSVLSKNASYDLLRIMASQPNTQVFVDHALVATIDAGGFYEFRNSKEAVFIQGNKPILVAQFNIGNNCNSLNNLGDPSMVLLNAVEQTRDSVTLYSSRFENITQNYLNIVTRTQSAVDEDIFLDGALISGSANLFRPVESNPDFSFASLQVSSGSHSIFTNGCGVIVTAYGYGQAESYAYSGGASFREINLNPIPEGGCLNDTLAFSSGLPEDRVQVLWDFGDGNTSTEPEPAHVYTELGSYPVELVVWDLCQGTVDTFRQQLLISLRQAVESGNDTLVCVGAQVFLRATDLPGARYEWNGPRSYFSEEQFPVLTNTDPAFTGDYSVVGIISGCATFPKMTYVEVQALPVPNLGNDSTLCEADPVTLDAGQYVRYEWQDGSAEPYFTLTTEGIYWVEVRDELGCAGRDSIFFRESCPTTLYVPSAFSPNGDGSNDLFLPRGQDLLAYHLRIFNRWGTVIFETQNIDEGWDGRTASGQLAPEGVYVWMVDYAGQRIRGSDYRKQEAGTVTLIR